MILLIDNYDSFVYTLARYVKKLDQPCEVHRNDKITLQEIEELAPDAIIISPGPRSPKDAGISIDIIKAFGEKTPILGVCLGHQAIAEAYGGKTIRSNTPVHGKSSLIEHNGSAIFQGIPSPFHAGRYHSLMVDLTTSENLHISARTESADIMAIEHNQHPVFGIQFHPESVLTPEGENLIKNFISIAYDFKSQ